MAKAKQPTKKKTVRVSTKKPKAYVSFKRAERDEPFFSFRFTQQTLYWLILGTLVIGLGIWVMYLNMKVQAIYDQIEVNEQMFELTDNEIKKF